MSNGSDGSALTHLTQGGEVHMVEVGDKAETRRLAVARGRLQMAPATLSRLLAGDLPKGEALATARVAAIQAVKRTADIIPLCHPLRITSIQVELAPAADRAGVDIEVTVCAQDRTGVEMEALHGVTAAGLTLYDMCKAVDKGMRLVDVHVACKEGGRSGPTEARAQGPKME